MFRERMLSHEPEKIEQDLKRLIGAGWIRDVYIFAMDGRTFLSSSQDRVVPFFTDSICGSCHLSQSTQGHNRAFSFYIKNSSECTQCHGSTSRVLGIVSLLPAESPYKRLLTGSLKTLLLVLIGAVVFIGLTGTWYVNHFIVNRLKNIREAIWRFRSGVFTPVKDDGDDEIAEICRAFNEMAERLIRHQSLLEESKAYLKNLFDNIQEMIVVIDRDCTIRFANKKVLDFLSLSEEDVIGSKCHKIFHDIDRPCFMSECDDKDSCGLEMAFAGQTVTTVHRHYTDRGRVYIQVKYIPFYQNNRVTHIIQMASDITEHYKDIQQRKNLTSYSDSLQGITDMETLMDTLVYLAETELNAEHTHLLIYDSYRTPVLKQRGRIQFKELPSELGLMTPEECMAGFVTVPGIAFVSENLDEYPPTWIKPLYSRAGLQSIVSIPLKIKDRTVGIYTLAYRQKGYFKKTDTSFFNLLEKTINTAIARIEQFREIIAQKERLRTLTELTERLSLTFELSETLEAINDAIHRILSPDITIIFFYNRQTRTLVPVSGEGLTEDQLKKMVIYINDLNIEFQPGEDTYSCTDIFKDNKWQPIRQIARRVGARAFYARCLFADENNKLGAIVGMWKRPHLPTLEEIGLFNTFSDFAAIAIKKVQLIEEVRRHALYWEDTFNSFSDPVFITDREFRIIKANRAFVEMIGHSNVIGSRCYQILHNRESPPARCAHNEALSTGKTISIEYEEEGRVFLYSYTPIRAEDGQYREVIHALKEITFVRQVQKEREKLREQLLHAQKMEAIGTLTGGIAHDFNNILTGVLGHAELALMKTRDEAILDNLKTIIAAAERAKDFVKQLLIFGKKSPMDRRIYDVRRLIEDSIKLIKRIIGEDIDLQLQMDPVPLKVRVDKSQFTQLLMNLCVNARDAMPEGGTLQIQARKVWATDEAKELQGEYVLLRVSDTGIGIPEEIQSRIFEPYFTTKTEGRGTGLGLSVVYSVVDSHGGFIKLNSQLNEGTTFEIYLPYVERTFFLESKELLNEPLPAGSEKILLVDDEEIIRDTGKNVLESLGYKVTVASSAQEALQWIRTDPYGFDLVISDLIMPGMKGTELYTEIKKIRKDMPFILITGYGSHLLNDEVRYRFNVIIEKPFNIKEIAYKVRYILDGE